MMLITMLAYPVTGFAVALCIYFFHAAWRGWYMDFSEYAVHAYGKIGSAFWFALLGPVVSARIAHLQAADADHPNLINAFAALAITIIWATMLGILCQETARLAFT